MTITKHLITVLTVVALVGPALAGKGYMGGRGDVVVEEPPTESTGGQPADVEGPLNDRMSTSGKLFGDLYVILRHSGIIGDFRLIPAVDSTGDPVLTNGVQLLVPETNTVAAQPVVGGEPVLTVVDVPSTQLLDYGWYAAEVGTNPDGTVIYAAVQSPYPALCVQPIANWQRWGDISPKTGLTKNRLPLVITYDATWNRSECAVGQIAGRVVADPATGDLTLPVNAYFIQPGGTWTDPVNGAVTYPLGVLWTDLVQEVPFGRLNVGRAPDAVLQSAFDEAIANINSPDTVAIEIDAAGRLLLTRNVYDPLIVDNATGEPVLLGTVKKAIDSPLENVALYIKLLQDGHLVTPGDQRAPIDRSKNGGVPLWKLLELQDGPAAAAVRPTIDIAKMRKWGLGSLVDVSETTYYTLYQCLDANGAVTECLCWNPDPVQPELTGEWIACPSVVNRVLSVYPTCPTGLTCAGPFVGIPTTGDYRADKIDMSFAAAFLAAGADKTGHITVDMVVYLNSILGINKVVGYSAYDAAGQPLPDAINYAEHPVYYNFAAVTGYDRRGTFSARGQVTKIGGDVEQAGASSYDGTVKVLQGASPTWVETSVPIITATMGGALIFDALGIGPLGSPNGEVASENALGFTQQSDDDLGVTRFIHTFQIPSLR